MNGARARFDGVIARYRSFLPLGADDRAVSLGEGNTPLLPAPRLSERLGAELYLKFEGANPTGSFKDRGMTVAVTRALATGARAVICASTGNTSAAAAAYAARAGLDCYVVIPDGKIALGKLAQALAYGAQVLAISGNFDDGLDLVRQIAAADPGIRLVNSINTDRIAGQMTGAFEIVDALGAAPDIVALPVGNAGNITAYWQGFQRYAEAGRTAAWPRLFGIQAAGAAPLVLGRPIDNPETVATAIRIGKPASWQAAEAAVAESGGLFDAVTDDEILAAYRLLAQLEGVFCEPASAAPVAGLLKLAAAGKVPPGSRVVAILTGNGLKDPDTALAGAGGAEAVRRVPATLAALQQALAGGRGQ